MNMNLLKKGMFLFALAIAAACSDDDPKISDVTINCTAPEGVESPVISNVQLTMKNISNGRNLKFPFADLSAPMTVKVEEGLYNVELQATIKYVMNDTINVNSRIKAFKENVSLIGETELDMEAYFDAVKNGFVFAEIFVPGTLDKETGEGYDGGDQYFRIMNNSDDTLYADGLCLFESGELTTSNFKLTPNIFSYGFYAATGYMVPGNGSEYPVAPGESILICDNAINHAAENANSWDLTKADFEWFAENPNPDYQDKDNPDVPNMIQIMKKSATLWTPHNRGFASYALAYLGDGTATMTPETFLSSNYFDYIWHFVFNTFEKDMKGSAYMLPNTWISDAVNMSVVQEFKRIATSPSLDKGYAYISEVDMDDTRFGYAVRRKVDASGKLVDDNDSGKDFEHRVKADPFHVFK